MKRVKRLLIYRKKIVQPYIDLFVTLTEIASYIMSIAFLLAVVFENGYVASFDELAVVDTIYDVTWFVFMVSSLTHILFDSTGSWKHYGRFTWIMGFFLYMTLLCVVFKEPVEDNFIRDFWLFFDSRIYIMVVLIILSLLKLSNGVILLLGKHLKPSFVFSVSFLIIIFIGAGLLMLPRSTYHGISFIDALFTSTSATCVTGLTTVDVATTFTPIGLFLIMLLIQIGGLGVMTLTSFFALFFMGNTSLYNQSMMCDMVSSKSLNSLLSTLMYILGFTLLIEAIGAVIIFLDIHGTMNMTFNEELGFAIFHSVSAFCNAGFSNLPNNLGNELLMKDNNLFYLTISFLVILGGIGFPILVNIFDIVKYYIKMLVKRYFYRKNRLERRVHLYDINTTIVVATTLGLLIIGTVSIAILEWNNALAGMPVIDKLTQSFFNAVSPRTAGFSSVAISSFAMPTIIIYMFLMVIGGGAQSTAGGIKVNVFSVVMLNIRSILLGVDNVSVCSRELSQSSINRSNSTVVLYTMFVVLGVFLLAIFEPNAPLSVILFEAISALSTVGSSLDFTQTLSSNGKLVIIALMFIGRIGVLTLVASLIKQHKNVKYKYPSGDIIIN